MAVISRQALKRAAFETCRWAFGQRRYRRFAVVAHARTGSNYLLDGLRQFPGFRVHHEVFASHERERGKDYENILSHVFRREPPWIRAVGLKVFYYHLTDQEWARLADESLSIIHLTRRNRLRTIVSLDIAFATDRWASSRSEDRPKRPASIQIDAPQLRGRLDEIARLEEQARARFREHPLIECIYEDLVSHPHEAFGRLGSFLGVSHAIDPDRIGLVRQNPQPLHELILNYDDVQKTLTGTPHEAYLASDS